MLKKVYSFLTTPPPPPGGGGFFHSESTWRLPWARVYSHETKLARNNLCHDSLSLRYWHDYRYRIYGSELYDHSISMLYFIMQGYPGRNGEPGRNGSIGDLGMPGARGYRGDMGAKGPTVSNKCYFSYIFINSIKLISLQHYKDDTTVCKRLAILITLFLALLVYRFFFSNYWLDQFNKGNLTSAHSAAIREFKVVWRLCACFLGRKIQTTKQTQFVFGFHMIVTIASIIPIADFGSLGLLKEVHPLCICR